MQTVYASGSGGGGSQQREVADGADGPMGPMYRVGQIKWHHFTFLLVTN